MLSLGEQLKTWRSLHRLSVREAASALGLSARTIDEIEQGIQLRGLEREALVTKLARPPGKAIRGPAPDSGYRPGKC